MSVLEYLKLSPPLPSTVAREAKRERSSQSPSPAGEGADPCLLRSLRRQEEVEISSLCRRCVHRVAVVPGDVELVEDSPSLELNKSAVLPSPCWCWSGRQVGGVLLPPICGSGGGWAPSFVGGSDGSGGDFAPRGSPGRTSSCFLWSVGEAASSAALCEYCLPLPLRRGAVKFPIGGVEAGSCACGVGSLDLREGSSTMAVSPVCWSSVAEVRDFLSVMAVYTRVLARGAAAATAARPHPAPVCVVFVRWSEDLVVISFTFGVLCTTSDLSI